MAITYGRRALLRGLALGALIVAFVVVLVILLGGSGGSYAIHVRFRDAGQLVKGDQAVVAGHPVGTISDITITDDGLADVKLKITDGAIRPLHVGTRASIGVPGASGVANRYVRLYPGMTSMPKIPDGGVLGTEQTKGIVDLDQLLDSLDRPTRERLQGILAEGADLFAQPAAGQANRALAFLNPALSRAAALGDELVRDQAAVNDLVAQAGTVASTLADRRAALGDSIGNTAAALREVASRRDALSDLLARAPAVLRQGNAVLGRTRDTLADVDPVVRHLRPVAGPAATLLRAVPPVLDDTLPALTAFRRLLPTARRTLVAFPGVARTTVPALQSAVKAFQTLAPIVRGLRPYTPDLIAGFFEGFGGNASGYYDANGHYARIAFEAGPDTVSVNGIAGVASGQAPASGGSGYQTGLNRKCPGAATEKAADGSSPFVPSDAQNLCDPAQTPAG